ncbi:something about silencing protein 10 [Aphis craccivora]|uniref:Something about silencing protein 10 n=1 Tax=Aphis craccivora TaxID=307492 RepID=A0A6G0YII7_APHCR|nr:something about silencing protein 10 [Aphis craccivora]
MKKKPWGRKQEESDDDASVDFDGENSESDYDENEKLLLEKTRKELAQGPYDSDEESEEEVFPLRNKLDQYEDSEEDDEEVENDIEQHSDDEEEKNINDSDIEGAESGSDDLPNDKAWGQLRRSFYNTDYLDKDHGGFEGEEDEETAKMEEEEARKIHQRMMSELENVDLDSELFIGTKVTDNVKEGTDTSDITQMMTVKKDLSSMSDREKRKLLMKESPELFGLITDFKTYMGRVQEKLSPFLKLVRSGDIPKSRFTEYTQCYFEIILNYCTNIGFYFLMKSVRKPVQNHPIMNRLLRYREMLCEQDKKFGTLILPQIDQILSNINTVESNFKASKNKPKKLLNLLTKPVQKTEKTVNIVKPKENNLQNVDVNQSNKFEDSVDEEEEDGIEVKEEPMVTTDEKRGITYQIAKNKGLTPRRKKELRNPRVKNRMKYRKAKIRRKGQISEPRKEIRRYDGEISGIKVNLSKSIKIKA